MKKKQICEGFVEYVDFPNKAVVTTKETDADGKEKEYKVVVKGARIKQSAGNNHGTQL